MLFNHYHFIVFSFILFCIGIVGMIIKKSLISKLIALELVLSSIQFNFVNINKFIHPQQIDGYLISLFILTISVAEVSIGLTLIYQYYKINKNLDTNNL